MVRKLGVATSVRVVTRMLGLAQFLWNALYLHVAVYVVFVDIYLGVAKNVLSTEEVAVERTLRTTAQDFLCNL